MTTTETPAILHPGMAVDADLVTGGGYVDSVYRGGRTVRCRGIVEEALGSPESPFATVVVRWQDGPAAGQVYLIPARVDRNVFPTSNVAVAEGR